MLCSEDHLRSSIQSWTCLLPSNQHHFVNCSTRVQHSECQKYNTTKNESGQGKKRSTAIQDTFRGETFGKREPERQSSTKEGIGLNPGIAFSRLCSSFSFLAPRRCVLRRVLCRSSAGWFGPCLLPSAPLRRFLHAVQSCLDADPCFALLYLLGLTQSPHSAEQCRCNGG